MTLVSMSLVAGVGALTLSAMSPGSCVGSGLLAHSKDVSLLHTHSFIHTVFQTHFNGILFTAGTELLRHKYYYTIVDIGLFGGLRKQHPCSGVRPLYFPEQTTLLSQ